MHDQLTENTNTRYAYLHAMGIDIWVPRTTAITQQGNQHTSRQPCAVAEYKMHQHVPLEQHAVAPGKQPRQQIKQQESTHQEARQVQDSDLSSANYSAATQTIASVQKASGQISQSAVMGQQNIALIQTADLLVVALIGTHRALSETYLELVKRMLHRCGVRTEHIQHSVLQSIELHHNLHFHDQQITDTVLSCINMQQQRSGQAFRWIILLSRFLQPVYNALQSQEQNPQQCATVAVLIEQELIDMITAPATRKQVWQKLLPLRQAMIPS